MVFGAKRLPELGRSVGRGMREFKESVSGEESPHELDAPAAAAPAEQAQAEPSTPASVAGPAAGSRPASEEEPPPPPAVSSPASPGPSVPPARQ